MSLVNPIKQHRDTGNIEQQQRIYKGLMLPVSVEDVRLLTSLDERHNTPSGPAAKNMSVLTPFLNKPNTNA